LATADATYTPQFFMPVPTLRDNVQNYYAFGQNMSKWSGVASVTDPKKKIFYRVRCLGRKINSKYIFG
jgi:hypothetical protein